MCKSDFPASYCREQKFPLALRIFWAAFSTLLLPSLLLRFGVPMPAAIFLSLLSGMAVYIALPGGCDIKIIRLTELFFSLKVTAVVLLLSAVAGAVWRLLLKSFDIPVPEKQQLAEMVAAADVPAKIILFFAVCILAPFLEELLFRKIIYTFWREYHAESAFMGTALLFALVHFYLPGIPGFIILGCGFQYAYLRSRNLSCAIATHILVNSGAFAANSL